MREHPVSTDGVVDAWPGLDLEARALDHRVPTFGWRLHEPDGRRMLPERLAEQGVSGPDVGRLQRAGRLELDGRVVTLDEVSVPRRGQAFAGEAGEVCADVHAARDLDRIPVPPRR